MEHWIEGCKDYKRMRYMCHAIFQYLYKILLTHAREKTPRFSTTLKSNRPEEKEMSTPPKTNITPEHLNNLCLAVGRLLSF